MQKKPSILTIIPARYASTRFPAKMLADIKGKTMIRRVYERVHQYMDMVVIATDNECISEEVASFGGKYLFTSPDHQSGTDRCAEVVLKMSNMYDYVLNIQGDEPFIHPQQIEAIVGLLSNQEVEIATLVTPITEEEDLFNPNVVKAIFNADTQKAVYFSRHCIPFLRNHPTSEWFGKHTFYRHIGIYAYRTDVLMKITQLAPSPLEKAESLEQLRWLENNFGITVGITPHKSIGIDTPEDLEKVLTNHTLWEDNRI